MALSPRRSCPGRFERVILSKSEAQPKNLKIEAAAMPDVGANSPLFAALRPSGIRTRNPNHSIETMLVSPISGLCQAAFEVFRSMLRVKIV